MTRQYRRLTRIKLRTPAQKRCPPDGQTDHGVLGAPLAQECGRLDRSFVPTLGGKLRLFFLPPFAPDRNPGALVWKHLEADTVGRMAATSQGKFREEGLPLAA